MANELPKDVTDPERANATSPVTGGAGEKTGQQPTGDFASHMQDNKATETQKSAKDPSPVELQKATNAASSPPSIQTVQGQINATGSSYADVKNKLHTKGLKLKQGEKQAVRDKLTDANESVRSANKHLGNDPGPQVNLHTTKNPIARYLALVADGQHQLQSASQLASQVGHEKGGVSPGKMLLVQVKLAHAQQALDFTSVLLGKAIEFVKSTMQTQI
jgi:hypothetical protein